MLSHTNIHKIFSQEFTNKQYMHNLLPHVFKKYKYKRTKVLTQARAHAHKHTHTHTHTCMIPLEAHNVEGLIYRTKDFRDDTESLFVLKAKKCILVKSRHAQSRLPQPRTQTGLDITSSARSHVRVHLGLSLELFRSKTRYVGKAHFATCA